MIASKRNLSDMEGERMSILKSTVTLIEEIGPVARYSVTVQPFGDGSGHATEPATFSVVVRDGDAVSVDPQDDPDERDCEAALVAMTDYRARHDIGTCPMCPRNPIHVIDRVNGLCPAHAAEREVAA